MLNFNTLLSWSFFFFFYHRWLHPLCWRLIAFRRKQHAHTHIHTDTVVQYLPVWGGVLRHSHGEAVSSFKLRLLPERNKSLDTLVPGAQRDTGLTLLKRERKWNKIIQQRYGSDGNRGKVVGKTKLLLFATLHLNRGNHVLYSRILLNCNALQRFPNMTKKV